MTVFEATPNSSGFSPKISTSCPTPLWNAFLEKAASICENAPERQAVRLDTPHPWGLLDVRPAAGRVANGVSVSRPNELIQNKKYKIQNISWEFVEIGGQNENEE